MHARRQLAAPVVAALAVVALVAAPGCHRSPPAGADSQGRQDDVAAADATDAGATSIPPTVAGPPSTLPPALSVANVDGMGPYLVDDAGHALYVLDADVAGASTCVDACLTNWPALVVPADTTSAPLAPVQAAEVGSVVRGDGLVQATYFKHPLYKYVDDAAAGQHEGHDVRDKNGHWSLVGVDGKAL